MDRTLYDVLEISRHAGPEAIQAAYQRLSGKHESASGPSGLPDNIDTQNSLKAIQEAFRILSTPARKERYDIYLDSISSVSSQVVEAVQFWTPLKIGFMTIVFMLSCLGYYNYRLAVAEKARQVAALEREQELARAEVERLRAEQESIALERQTQAAQDRQEMINKFETERARMEAQQIIRQETVAEERARQNSQRLAQQAASSAERQASIERQKYENQRRQEEMQRQQEQARQDRLLYMQQQQQARSTVPDQREIQQLQNNAKLRAMQAF